MKKNLLIFGVLLIASLFFVTGCQKEIGEKQTYTQLWEVHFDPMITFEQMNLLEQKGVSFVQMRVVFIDRTTGEIHYAGKTFADGEQFVASKFLHESQSFFDDVKENIDDQKMQDLTDAEREIEKSLQNEFSFDIDVKDAKVDMLSLEVLDDNQVMIQNMLESLHGEITHVSLKNQGQQNDYIELRNGISWVPDVGRVRAYNSSYGTNNRFVYHQFKWSEKRRPFGNWYTYEHDFFLNDYPESTLPGTYLSKAVNYWGFPLVSYWSSNLPYAYLDTRYLDDFGVQGSNYELAYTIGSGNAHSIHENKWYYTYLRMRKGSANRDNAKLNAQLGTQIPVGSTSVWNSFGVANYLLVYAWNISLPGTTYWHE